jgi:hypothetical protein
LKSSEKKSFEKVIKESVDFKITELEVEDVDASRPLEYLEDLKPNMSVKIDVGCDVGRDMIFNLDLRVAKDLTVSQIGTPVSAFPKVGELEDTSKYLPTVVRCGQQIVDAINKAVKEQRQI